MLGSLLVAFVLGFILTVSKMVTIRQEGPPPGGYGPIDWSKKVGKRLNGFAVFGAYIGLTVGSYLYWKMIHRPKIGREAREMMDCRIAISPLLYAEGDRILLKQMRACRDEEAELMKDNPDWEVGKLGHTPVYHNPREKYITVHPNELYAHSDIDHRSKRLARKFWR